MGEIRTTSGSLLVVTRLVSCDMVALGDAFVKLN